MRDKDPAYRHERRGLQFLQALQRGDAATLAGLWEEAATDPVLEALFANLLEDETDAAQGPPLSPDEERRTGPGSRTSPPAGRPPLPPLPTVIVRHRLPATKDRAAHAQARYDKETSLDAGSFKKAR